MIDLTIIIPTLNTTGDKEQDKKIDYSLTQCLNSLQETAPDIPVIVVSNGIDRKYIPTQWKNVSRIDIEDQGQCKAVNAAVAITNTEWILITNDDMIFSPGWLSEMIMCNAMNTNRACLSARLVEPNDGAPTFIKYFCGGAGGDFDKEKFLKFAKEHKDPHHIRRGFNLPLLIKRELWDLVGGYDINYDPWGASSDTDLQCKVELAGKKTFQCQNALVYHFSQTSGTFHPKNHGYWSKNYEYFRNKWGFERPGGDDVWNSRNLIDEYKLKYEPWWKGFYEK